MTNPNYGFALFSYGLKSLRCYVDNLRLMVSRAGCFGFSMRIVRPPNLAWDWTNI